MVEIQRIQILMMIGKSLTAIVFIIMFRNSSVDSRGYAFRVGYLLAHLMAVRYMRSTGSPSFPTDRIISAI